MGVDTFDALVGQFARERSITIEATAVGGARELFDRLAETDRAEWPNIVIASEGATAVLSSSGQFLAPEECDPTSAWAVSMLPVVKATYTVADRLVALPYGVSAPVLYFDVNEFRAAGLDPSAPPKTLEELLETSRVIRDSGASPRGLVLTDWVAHWVIEQYSAKRGVELSTSANGRSQGDVVVDLVSDDVVADLELIRLAIRDGHVAYIGPNPSNYADLLRIVDFEDGATMTIQTSAALGEIAGLIAAGAFPGVELGVAQLPGPALGSLVGGNALWIADAGDLAENGAAWDLASWLVAAPQLARFAAASGYVPFTDSARDEPAMKSRWAELPELRVAYDQLAAMPDTPAAAGLLVGPSFDFDYVLYAMSNQLMASDDDIRAALVVASDQANNLLKEYEDLSD